MVVIEVLKHRFNRGLRNNLHFYRDSKGNEADLLLEFGTDVFPLEVKAGATVAPDSLKGLKNFRLLGRSQPWGSGLVYGGAEAQQRTDATVCPVIAIHDLLDTIGNS